MHRRRSDGLKGETADAVRTLLIVLVLVLFLAGLFVWFHPNYFFPR